MALNLADYDNKAREAIQIFWGRRKKAREKQLESGNLDQGERAGVTAGKNMDGFVELIIDLVKKNGLAHADIHRDRALLTLPGFFRPTKLWDFIVMHDGKLVAAVELKSQVGPSFGNNFNNRAEEAIGTAQDLRIAYREGAFGKQQRPFIGWLILVEDAEASRKPVKNKAPHFPVLSEFRNASYLERYDLLCQKLVQEQLYTSASIITSERKSISTGNYSNLSEMTSLKTFVTTFAGHIAAEAARG